MLIAVPGQRWRVCEGYVRVALLLVRRTQPPWTAHRMRLVVRCQLWVCGPQGQLCGPAGRIDVRIGRYLGESEGKCDYRPKLQPLGRGTEEFYFATI
jgi:hypothetical protein